MQSLTNKIHDIHARLRKFYMQSMMEEAKMYDKTKLNIFLGACALAIMSIIIGLVIFKGMKTKYLK